MTLWLVRHAQPVTEPGVCYGALDLPAEAAATRRAAQALADRVPGGALVSTSPLQRCQQLALDLRVLRPDLSYKTETALAEMNFGCWEGQRWDSIPQAALAAWTADFWLHRFGGVQSVADLVTQVAALWDAQASVGNRVWITHAGVIRAASLLAQGVRRVDDAAQWPLQAPGFGQWCWLDIG
jgi:alpha-ribazole phosphatase